MAIAHVQSRGGTATGASSISLAFLSNNTAGNLLVAGVSADADPTGVTDTNTTYQFAVGDNRAAFFLWSEIWYTENCAGGANTVQASAAGNMASSLSIAEYSGIASSGALDQVTSATGSGTNNVATGNVTTTVADELLVFVGGAEDSGRTFTPGANYDERTDTGGLRPMTLCDRIVASTGSYNGSATASANGGFVALLATFEAAPAPPPVSAALSGTATNTLTNEDVQIGGKTIILTLTEDTWVASGATFNGQRQNIIDGLDSDGSAPAGWDAVVKAGQSVTGVVRTSDTVVTITLDAFPAYSIATPEIVTATVPGTVLTGGNPLVATPTFQVYVKGVRVGCN